MPPPTTGHTLGPRETALAGMSCVEGIERSLTTCSGEPDCVSGHVRSALLAHEAGRRPGDDQTLLVIRMEG